MKHLMRAMAGIALLALAAVQSVTAGNIEHVVRKGDTLYHISKLYGVPVAVLLQVNGISNARSLKVGMKLEIPQTYLVKKGDTLYSIARDHGIALDELVTINHISKNHIIKVGERLILPTGADQAQSIVEAQGGAAKSARGTDSAEALSGNSALQPASMGADAAHFWPASGRRTFLTGKLEGGTQITGSVGDPVFAVAGGRVVWVGPYRGYGRVVFVESRSGFIYVYGGAETTLVKVGDRVTPGTQVANMGINPHLGQACAYFFVYKNGRPVNPKTAPRG